jgi:hypothetical protein
MQKLREFAETAFNHERFNLIAFGLIGLLTLVAYSNTFTASFHFDDNTTIVENASIRQVTGDSLLEVLKGARPVVYLSIMLNYQLGGLNVVGWHVFNIGVHIINSIFVYLLILWTLSLPRFAKNYAARARRMALFGALLFAVHPIQTESVTYIVSRTELLATVFYLATVLLFIKGARTGKLSYAAGMFATSLLSMGSKEWAVTLPAVLLLYDFLFFAEGKVKPVLSRWHLYVATALPWALVAHHLDLTSEGGVGGVGFNLTTQPGLTPWTYLLTSFNVIWTYIRLLFLPINQNLDYDYPIAKTLFEMPTILSLIGHIAVVAAAFWLWRGKKWTLIPFGLAWFYIGLSPTQSFVPIKDMIFEHRAYMPSIGFFLSFVVAFEMMFEWPEGRRKKSTIASAS